MAGCEDCLRAKLARQAELDGAAAAGGSDPVGSVALFIAVAAFTIALFAWLARPGKD